MQPAHPAGSPPSCCSRAGIRTVVRYMYRTRLFFSPSTVPVVESPHLKPVSVIYILESTSSAKRVLGDLVRDCSWAVGGCQSVLQQFVVAAFEGQMW